MMAEDQISNVVITQIVEAIFENSSSSEDEELLIEQLADERNPIPRIQNYVENVVALYSDSQFQSHFRMQRHTFEFLLSLIGPTIKKINVHPGRPSISVEKQLLMTLWILGTPDSYRSVCDRFGVGKATAIMCVRRVVKVLYNKSNIFIKWPTLEEMEESKNAFRAISNFPDVIGAIDGTHIAITAPTQHPEAYVNRKGIHSVQLQGICNEKGIFIHCYAGHPGSVHDQRVLANSEIADFLKCDVKFPGGVHLLGDAAYTLHTHLLVPYKDNGHLTARQVNYNRRHSSTRMVIERAFGLLKGRLRRLLYTFPMCRVDLIPKYIMACCVIHNICLLQRDEFQPLILTLQNGIPDILVPDAEIVCRNERDLARRKRNEIAAELAMHENPLHP